MPGNSIVSYRISKISGSELSEQEDFLAAEEPLEIRLITGPLNERKLKSISVTMRTPGNDPELAIGFLFTEGIIQNIDQVEEVFNNPEDCNNRQDNKINIVLKPEVNIDLSSLERNFYTTSSCGVCGKASINSIRTVCPIPSIESQLSIDADIIGSLPGLLRQQQDIFDATGGLHASALFDPEARLLMLREDVGRHNALDKLIGSALKAGIIPLSNHILLLSGRASFELIQKAAMAGVRIVAAVGAPSSLAVDLAREFNMTLIGFLRKDRYNIYSGKLE